MSGQKNKPMSSGGKALKLPVFLKWAKPPFADFTRETLCFPNPSAMIRSTFAMGEVLFLLQLL